MQVTSLARDREAAGVWSSYEANTEIIFLPALGNVVSVGRWSDAGIGWQGRHRSTPVTSAAGRLSQRDYNEFKASGVPE